MRQEKVSYQRWMSILVLLLLVALTSFVVAGCSGGSEAKKEGTSTEKAKSESNEAEGESAEEATEVNEAEVTDPAVLYTNNCGACHGHDGSGVVGPAINGTSLTAEQIQKTVENGGQSMPKFRGGELTEEQIKIIANYVKTTLK